MPRLFSSLFVFTLLFSNASFVLAEEASTTPATAPSAPSSQSQSPLNCFDYYHFGSIQADLQPTLNQTVPGATLTFTGKVVNANDYPILDGTLYVKIFRRDETVFAVGDGNPVVDQFVIADNLTLIPKGTKDLTYTWKVPQNAAGGEYYAAYFFTTAKRYNLMGLSFTDDVVGNQAPFTITSDSKPAVISKTKTTLNGQDHHFAAFPLHFTAGDTVTVKTTITNPSDQPKTLPLQWNQYAWDAMNKDNLRFTKTEVVTLAPNETKEVSYEVQPQQESVVYVIAVTQDLEAKSILDIRYVRDGIEESRINFPGIMKFPLAKGESTTLFACAHSTNQPVVPGNTLTLTLKDRDGKTIHEYRYEGDLTGAMGGYGETFAAPHNISYATLTATLQRNGVIVEQVTQTYDCQTIDPGSCLPEDTAYYSLFDYLKTHVMTTILTIVIVLLIVALAVFLYKKRRGHYDGSGPMSLLLLVLLFGLFIPQQIVTATTIQTSWAASCPIGWVDTALIDDSDGNHHLGEDERSGGQVQLCLSTDNPDITLGSVWGWQGCNAGYDHMIVYDDAGSWSQSDDLPAFHGINENNYRPNGSYDNYWCVGARGGGAFRVNATWRPGTSCASGETFVAKTRSGYYNLNSGTQNSPTESLCISVAVNASVGPAHGRPVSSAPTSGLCNTGIASAVSGSGPWTWTCYGENGGSDSEGSAPLFIPPSNNPPNQPTLTNCSMTGVVNTLYSFDITGNDGDGDTIRYGIDWDNNNSIDEWVPGSSYVNSGTSQTASRTWTTAGTYTFNVLTQDSKGSSSGWANCGVTITAPPSCSDGIQNQDETGIDTGGVCTPPPETCSDGIQNQDETGIDTGGVCTPPGQWVSVNSGAFFHCADTAITFQITGHDDEGNTVRFSIDWDEDGGYDELLPSDNSYVPSDTQLTLTHSWSSSDLPFVFGRANVYFRVKMETSAGKTIENHWPISFKKNCIDLKVNNSDGPLVVGKNTPLNITWIGQGNISSCSLIGNGTWLNDLTVPGSTTGVAIWSDVYVIQCQSDTGLITDRVNFYVVNQIPNPPTISYVSGTRETGQTINFTIQGTDADSDNIFYEVDWDNNGTVDATTATVPSGTAQPANHSWSTAGTQTFQARTVDTAGARSAWTQHSETIAAAPPTATLEVSINGGAYSTNDATIDPGDTISLKWSSANAATCTGTNFNTSNNPSGTVNPGAPAPNTATTYTLTCGTASDSLTVTTRQRPNFTQPSITYNLSATFNSTTGYYDWIDVTFNTTNNGGSDTKASANYQFQFDRGRNGYEYSTTGSLGLLTVGQTVNRTERVTGSIPFGNTRIQVTADNTNAVTEADESDNVRTYDLTLPPPDPGLHLITDRQRVRQGETVILKWQVDYPYTGLSCRLYGPNTTYTGFSGSSPSAAIQAQSVYTLECTEATTGTVFTTTATVEVEGTVEEV